jgi:hypothetical protein
MKSISEVRAGSQIGDVLAMGEDELSANPIHDLRHPSTTTYRRRSPSDRSESEYSCCISLSEACFDVACLVMECKLEFNDRAITNGADTTRPTSLSHINVRDR